MEKIKIFLKYSGTLIIIVAILLCIMLMEIKLIPRDKIEKNIKSSISVLQSNSEVKAIKKDEENTFLHVYADEILLNIIYCMNENEPLKSIMSSNYYAEGQMPSLEKAIEEDSFGNTEYMRYWHGSTIIIRPLLIFFNISQIYYLFAGVLIILLIVLLIILIKKKLYLLVIAFLLGLLMTTSQYVPFCLEYVWTYLIMIITAIISIILEKKEEGNRKINLLMFSTGIITCFLDFLSTETITFTIPILIIFVIRNKEGRIQDIKKELKQIILWMVLWLIGYACMWGVKWLLSSIILNLNSLEYVVDKAMIRVVKPIAHLSLFGKIKLSLYKNVIMLNTFDLFNSTIKNIGILICVIISIILLRKEDKKEIKKTLIILGIGAIPYIRYMVMSGHSTNHFFFTFRAQIVTIISIIIGINMIIDKNKFNKKVEISKRKIKDGK